MQEQIETGIPMNTEERLAAIEVQLIALCRSVHQHIERMDRLNDRLETVTRLEERWQSLDSRLCLLTNSFEKELVKRANLDEGLLERVRTLESSTGMNSHGRDLLERIVIFLVGGVSLFFVQSMWVT